MFIRVMICTAVMGLLVALGHSRAIAGEWIGESPEMVVDPIDVAALMAAPESRLDQRISVSGRMTDVCTNKGCWAVLESGGQMLRVVARDHGFAIPKDARGPAVAHGVLERRDMSQKAARHMVEDDGADRELLENPVEYRLQADGVRLTP